MVCDDVDAALAAGVKTINLSAPMSDAQIAVKFGGSRAAMLVALRDVVGYARRQGLTVALGGEDASRAGPAELAPVLDLAEKLGVHPLPLSRIRWACSIPSASRNASARSAP